MDDSKKCLVAGLSTGPSLGSAAPKTRGVAARPGVFKSPPVAQCALVSTAFAVNVYILVHTTDGTPAYRATSGLRLSRCDSENESEAECEEEVASPRGIESDHFDPLARETIGVWN